MPRVPVSTDEQMAQLPNPVTGDRFVDPSNLLMATAHMNDTGRLFVGEGGRGRFGSLKAGKAKPSKSMKAR